MSGSFLVRGGNSWRRSATIVAEEREITLTPDLVTINRKTFKQSSPCLFSSRSDPHAHYDVVREFTPNVIEPSFGFGRILYALLEHAFWCREQDVERGVLSLPPVVAPTKVLIVPLSAKEEFDPLVLEVCASLSLSFCSVLTRNSQQASQSRHLFQSRRLQHVHWQTLCAQRRARYPVRHHP